MKFFPRVLTIALGFWTAIFLGFLFVLLIAVGGQGPSLVPGTILVVNLDTPMPDKESAPSAEDVLLGSLSGPGVPMHKVVQSLRRASEDKNIVGLFMTGQTSAGWANLQALRRALLNFKTTSGKPMYASFSSMSEDEYYLASLCDTIALNPLGVLEINGFSLGTVYMAEALEKFGLEVQVSRVGKYKSAVEPYLYSEMTPENVEQLRGILESFQDQFLVSAKEPSVSRKLLSLINNQGILGATDAVGEGLIHKIAYRDEVLSDLNAMSGVDDVDSFSQISLKEYAQTNVSSSSEGDIAVVFAQGTIMDGAYGQGIGGDTFSRELRDLRDLDEVKAVVMRINSPGGSATASEVILREVDLLRESGKKVIVSMGNLAASGGYWIACKADKIVAEETTITGSIGVFGMMPNFSKAAERLGLYQNVVRTGPFSDYESPWRPKEEEELAMYQSFVDEIYDGFLERVSVGRNLDVEAVHNIAQGRVWSGRDALGLGLVDELGGLDDAIALAKKELNDENATVFYNNPSSGPFDGFLRDLMDEDPAPFGFIRGLPLHEVEMLLSLLRTSSGVTCWARLPFLLNFY